MREVLVLEDLPDAAAMLRNMVNLAFPDAACRIVASLAAARAALADHVPDLALVDLGLPDGSGIDFIEQLSRQHPACITVVSSITGDDAQLFAALKAGAQGYLLKEQPAPELATLLRGIAQGQPPLSPAIARRLIRHFQLVSPPDEAHLTSRERQVLTLLARGLRLTEIAADLGISRHTVSDHVKHIYGKLNISSRAEAALRARSLGLA